MAGGSPGDVVVVDWLGRGGITQCAEAWAAVVAADGGSPLLVSRAGRELDDSVLPTSLVAPGRGGRLGAHASVVARAVSEVRRRRPAVVVVQGYVIPAMEEPLFRAARRAGARVVMVVHDQQHHTRTSGSHARLTALVRAADVVVAHTEFVARSVTERAGVRCRVVPVPVQEPMLGRPRPERSPVPPGAGDLAVYFGVLDKGRAKGTDRAVALARGGVDGWRFAFLGVGAPEVPGATTVDRFLDAGDLVAAVADADVALFPYRVASQSGAVALAQSLGTVPVVTAVGGLAEQVVEGEAGVVMAPDASVEQWADTLASLTGPVRAALVAAGHAEARRRRAAFAAAVRDLS